MQFHSHANQSHFHKNGFALRLALKQRHKGTQKWPNCRFWYIKTRGRKIAIEKMYTLKSGILEQGEDKYPLSDLSN